MALSDDAVKAWTLVEQSEKDPARSNELYAQLAELDTEDLEVQAAAQVLATQARLVNLLADLAPGLAPLCHNGRRQRCHTWQPATSLPLATAVAHRGEAADGRFHAHA